MCSTSTTSSSSSSPVSVVHRPYDTSKGNASSSSLPSAPSLETRGVLRSAKDSSVLLLDEPQEFRSSKTLQDFAVGAVAGAGMLAFSLIFPYLLAPWSLASDTYHFAFFQYDPVLSQFDNTIHTYGTDYFLAFCMLLWASHLPTQTPGVQRLAWLSRGMLAMYMLSVLAGAMAHHWYVTVDSKNTWHFRLLWTICVGTVTAVPGFMGAIGTELVQRDRRQGLTGIPLLPTAGWVGYSAMCTAIVVAGGVSFQRPACDIFIAGITQSPCSFYMIAILAKGIPMCPVGKWTRIIGSCSFVMNAPLLPLYPLLVHYTDWSLGAINFLLHSWLFLSWSTQARTLQVVARGLSRATLVPPGAVPLKRKAA